MGRTISLIACLAGLMLASAGCGAIRNWLDPGQVGQVADVRFERGSAAEAPPEMPPELMEAVREQVAYGHDLYEHVYEAGVGRANRAVAQAVDGLRFVLTALGSPVERVPVTTEQVEDRVVPVPAKAADASRAAGVTALAAYRDADDAWRIRQREQAAKPGGWRLTLGSKTLGWWLLRGGLATAAAAFAVALRWGWKASRAATANGMALGQVFEGVRSFIGGPPDAALPGSSKAALLDELSKKMDSGPKAMIRALYAEKAKGGP